MGDRLACSFPDVDPDVEPVGSMLLDELSLHLSCELPDVALLVLAQEEEVPFVSLGCDERMAR